MSSSRLVREQAGLNPTKFADQVLQRGEEFEPPHRDQAPWPGSF